MPKQQLFEYNEDFDTEDMGEQEIQCWMEWKFEDAVEFTESRLHLLYGKHGKSDQWFFVEGQTAYLVNASDTETLLRGTLNRRQNEVSWYVKESEVFEGGFCVYNNSRHSPFMLLPAIWEFKDKKGHRVTAKRFIRETGMPECFVTKGKYGIAQYEADLSGIEQLLYENDLEWEPKLVYAEMFYTDMQVLYL